MYGIGVGYVSCIFGAKVRTLLRGILFFLPSGVVEEKKERVITEIVPRVEQALNFDMNLVERCKQRQRECAPREVEVYKSRLQAIYATQNNFCSTARRPRTGDMRIAVMHSHDATENLLCDCHFSEAVHQAVARLIFLPPYALHLSRSCDAGMLFAIDHKSGPGVLNLYAHYGYVNGSLCRHRQAAERGGLLRVTASTARDIRAAVTLCIVGFRFFTGSKYTKNSNPNTSPGSRRCTDASRNCCIFRDISNAPFPSELKCYITFALKTENPSSGMNVILRCFPFRVAECLRLSRTTLTAERCQPVAAVGVLTGHFKGLTVGGGGLCSPCNIVQNQKKFKILTHRAARDGRALTNAALRQRSGKFNRQQYRVLSHLYHQGHPMGLSAYLGLYAWSGTDRAQEEDCGGQNVTATSKLLVL
ncbi:hypothetical protein GQ600_27221 [Phytophthora cactorum]|nr:hypothetical protein GQ600_27221 [Phytophthora cactorum]